MNILDRKGTREKASLQVQDYYQQDGWKPVNIRCALHTYKQIISYTGCVTQILDAMGFSHLQGMASHHQGEEPAAEGIPGVHSALTDQGTVL